MPSDVARVTRGIAKAVALLGAATAAYLLVPVGAIALDRVIVVAVAFVLGIVAATALIVWQVRSYRRAAESGEGRLLGLLMALYVTVLFFALVYDVLATTPGQMSGLETRLDGLYFSLTVISTVGFGDIHASGQAARAVVSLQIAFDLLFISLALAAVKAVPPPNLRSPPDNHA